MRNLLYLFLLLSLAGCVKHDVDLVFDALPEERMQERNAELKNKLLESTTGWKAFLRTSLSGSGYGFYMNFNSNEEVVMYSDWNNTYAATAKTSTWRITYVMNTQISFDTYNYITIMQDPQSSVNGGTQPNGLQSDIEFEYIRSSADTVLLQGKKYKNYLYLMKASATEAASYTSGGYLTAINALKTFVTTKNNNYVLVANGAESVKLGFVLNTSSKLIDIQGQLANGTIASATTGFGYSIDGAYFTNAVTVLGYTFVALKLKDANTLVLIDASGKEYPVLQNPTPVVDFINAFGLTKTYNSIYFYGKAYTSSTAAVAATLPSGVTSDFNTEYSSLSSRFVATSRYIDTLEFRLYGTVAWVKIWYWSGSTHYLADATFAATWNNDVVTLGTYTPSYSNTNWTTRITQIGSFLTWLQSGPFKAAWVASSTAGSPNLGGIYKVSNANDFLYGLVRKQ